MKTSHALAISGYIPCYFASPSVFCHEAELETYHDAIRQASLKRGINMIMPYMFNGNLPDTIVELDTAALERCQIMLADLDPYMGGEPDSGTAFEVGFFRALKKPVYGFGWDTRRMAEKHDPYRDALTVHRGESPRSFSALYRRVEHDSSHNLMLAKNVKFFAGGFLNALDRIVEDLKIELLPNA